MYLSNEVLNWHKGYDASGVDFEYLIRSHNIWRHAKNRLHGNPSEFDIVDCITSLKRAINSRLKTLTKEYCISELPNLRNKKQQLEKLQDYGLVRPTFLKALFELRNLLEHEDTKVPTIESCNYYIDIVWYFLKSTDSLLQMKNDNVFFSELESYDWDDDNNISIEYKIAESWDIRIGVNVERRFVSNEKVDNWIELTDIKIIEGRAPDGFVCLVGHPKLNDKLLTLLAREYFGSMGYWYNDHT